MNYRRYTALQAPFGTLYLTLDGEQLSCIGPQKPTIADALRSDGHPLLRQASQEVCAYFEGRSRTPMLPCNESFSPFQRSVFEAVKAIPYGETRSLKVLADIIDRPNATHAIDMLCQSNPFWIAVPTHRVLTSEKQRHPHLSAEETLRRMEKRYASHRLTKP